MEAPPDVLEMKLQVSLGGYQMKGDMSSDVHLRFFNM